MRSVARPTPNIELMDRRLVERNFAERLRQLAERIDALPTVEILRCAADMLEAGVATRLVISVAQRAVDRLRREAGA